MNELKFEMNGRICKIDLLILLMKRKANVSLTYIKNYFLNVFKCKLKSEEKLVKKIGYEIAWNFEETEKIP
jgi:hypothetical protein